MGSQPEGRSDMVAKLMKLLSGIAAMAGRAPNNPPVACNCPENDANELAALGEKYRSLLDTNVALIQERRELRKRLQTMESMSDATRGNEHAAELDRVKAVLRDRHGFSVSRAQIASAVEDLSRQLEATGAAARKASASHGCGLDDC